jgi:glycerol-3-phosphate dehydrogenase (NAD(P)+)
MNIAILGSGAYGIALSKVLNNNGNNLTLWTKFQDEVDILSLNRENSKLLPSILIDNNVKITSNLEDTIKSSDIVILAVPMNAIREVCKNVSNYITNQILVIMTKGIDTETLQTTSQIIKETINTVNVAVVSGPSFAIELASFNKLGLTIASDNQEINNILKDLFKSENIILNVTKDIIGVEICASIKNVFAIIMGMMDSKSDSTKATMLTVLLNDLRLICEILGGQADTIFKFAGIGDFLLTCMNEKSRNYTFGKLLIECNNKDKCFERMNTTTVEGLYTLESIYTILNNREISVKSINILYDIIYNNNDSSMIDKCLE